MFEVHDDLIEDNRGFTTWKFCAPIFIATQFGMILAAPLERDEIQDQATFRNGTLTFIEVNGLVYGVTCRHVAKALQNCRRDHELDFKDKFGEATEIPESSKPQFFIPCGKLQIHVNSIFYEVDWDEYTDSGLDVAIARIDPSILAKIDRMPIPISRVKSGNTFGIEGFCGLATGYPEAERRTTSRNRKIDNLHISGLTLLAEFSFLNESKLNLCSELESIPLSDNLSGMSGGPIFWSNAHDWALVGIAFKARDLCGSPAQQRDSLFSKPTILVDGEVVSKEKISSWIACIPEGDSPVVSCSQKLYIPKTLDFPKG